MWEGVAQLLDWFKPPLLHPLVVQEFTSGVVSEGVLRKIVQKICRNLQDCVLLRQERARKLCGKYVKICENSQTNFGNDPFPNDPISALLSN